MDHPVIFKSLIGLERSGKMFFALLFKFQYVIANSFLLVLYEIYQQLVSLQDSSHVFALQQKRSTLISFLSDFKARRSLLQWGPYSRLKPLLPPESLPQSAPLLIFVTAYRPLEENSSNPERPKFSRLMQIYPKRFLGTGHEITCLVWSD